MAQVFDVLSADHNQVKEILARLEAGPTRSSGGTHAQLEERRQLADRLIIECSKHEAVEEQYFWPTVRDRVPGGEGLSGHAISQEDVAKLALNRLDKIASSDPEFDDLLANFIPAAREHIAFEEDQVWPPLRQVLSAAEAAQLGDKITDGKKTAPTRPHPRTPATPGALKTAGSAAATADKLRDAATGRGWS
jgi:hemerythrin-like domain-containing protein